MTDVVSSETRSRMMSGIRGKNTKPELLIRKLLHGRGFRFRLHDKRLPGKPDIVLPRYRTVILIHGCFWHGHDCHLFKHPSSNADFWSHKFTANRTNDSQNIASLCQAGWKVIIMWECAVKGKTRIGMDAIAANVIEWIRDASWTGIREIGGKS